MKRRTPLLSRRTALRTAASTILIGLAGCLDNSKNSEPSSTNTSNESKVFQRVTIEGTALVVEFGSNAEFGKINIIQPDGELFDQREIAAGSRQVSFDLGTSYSPGEYTIVALSDEQRVGESNFLIRPEIEIKDVGLYRNNPDKRWDEVYGDTATDRLKNGEAFVTVQNTGRGPDAVTELVFSGDVPNPVDNPRGSGMYETGQVSIPPGETVDLFSNSFPFGSKSAEGMGCSPDGNEGEFTVTVESRVMGNQISNTFNVRYSGSTEMSDCQITITEA